MKKILLSVLALLLFLPANINAEEVKENNYPHDSSKLAMASENYVLMDKKTGVIVSGRNTDKKIHPASITKAITAITALEMKKGDDLNELMTVVPDIFPIDTAASIAFFNPDDKFTYDDVFYGLALPSGADAANALSFDLTGTAEGLADDMNALAKKIGMNNTNFVNTTGLDDDDHLTTVYDLALGIRYALDNDDFRRYYTASEHTSGKTRMYPNGIDWQDSTLKNAEKLEYNQIIGAKSGYTMKAQRSVSLLLEIDGVEYIYVSTNAERSLGNYITINDAMKIVNDIETNFNRVELFIANTPIKEQNVLGLNGTLPIQFKESELYYLAKDQNVDNIEYVYKGLPKVAFKKIKEGTEIGTLSIMNGEEVLFESPLLAQADYELSVFMMILIGVVMIFAVGLIGMLLAMAYFAIIRKRNRYRRHKSIRR